MAVGYVCVYMCVRMHAHACVHVQLKLLYWPHYRYPTTTNHDILEHTHTVHFKLDIRKILGMAGIVFNPGQTSEPLHSFLTHF